MLDEHWEAVGELRALLSSASRVQELVLKRSDETSSLAVSLSLAIDQVEGRVDTTIANGGPIGVGCHLVALP
jgi:hypothetical protein